jgi:adenine deaminase
VGELQLLVEAGLTPAEALQAATRDPARFLGFADSLGTVETGKLADLVLLERDPLLDIRNVRSVHGVILGGRFHSAEQLGAFRTAAVNRVAVLRDSLRLAGPPAVARLAARTP